MAKGNPDRVAVLVYLPREVVAWLDAKAVSRFKRRATYLTDLVISLYDRERQKT